MSSAGVVRASETQGRTPTTSAIGGRDISDLVNRCRTLVSSRLRDGVSSDSLVESSLEKLRMLESRDPRFHHYAIVEQIKGRLVSSALGDAVEARVTELVIHACTLNASNDIAMSADGFDGEFTEAVAEVLAMPEFSALQQDVVCEVEAAVSKLISGMERIKEEKKETNRQRARYRGARDNRDRINRDRIDSEASLEEEEDPWNAMIDVAEQLCNNNKGSDNNTKSNAAENTMRNSPEATAGGRSNSFSISDRNTDGSTRGSKDPDADSLDRFSQFSFGTLPEYDKIPGICENMNTSRPEANRRAAASDITEFSPGDLLHSEFWPQIRAAIISALNDPIPELKRRYLNLVWKLYRDAAPVQTGEIYMCLITHMINVANESSSDSSGGLRVAWEVFESFIPALRNQQPGINEESHSQPVAAHVRRDRLASHNTNDSWGYLAQVQFLNSIQRDFARHQVYFPDSLLAKIAICTFNLLQITFDDRSAANPGGKVDGPGFAEMLAACDPSAKWFESWMCTARPRDQLVNYAWQTGVVLHLVSHVMSHCPEAASSPIKPGAILNSSGAVHKSRIDVETSALGLLHSLSMLGTLLSYKESRRALRGREFYLEGYAWRQDQRKKGLRMMPAKGNSTQQTVVRFCATPEEIETSPIRCTNNLIRACTRGALWRNANESLCQSVGMNSTVETEGCGVQPSMMHHGCEEAEAEMGRCDGGMDLTLSKATVGWWLQKHNKMEPKSNDMVTCILQCFCKILSQFENSGDEGDSKATSNVSNNYLTPELNFLLSNRVWRHLLGEILEKCLSSTALCIDDRDIEYEIEFMGISRNWPFLLSEEFVSRNCFPTSFPPLKGFPDSSNITKSKQKQQWQGLDSFGLVTRISSSLLATIVDHGPRNLVLSSNADSKFNLVQTVLNFVLHGLDVVSDASSQSVGLHSSPIYKPKNEIAAMRTSIKRYLISMANLLRDPLASGKLGCVLLEPLLIALKAEQERKAQFNSLLVSSPEKCEHSMPFDIEEDGYELVLSNSVLTLATIPLSLEMLKTNVVNVPGTSNVVLQALETRTLGALKHYHATKSIDINATLLRGCAATCEIVSSLLLIPEVARKLVCQPVLSAEEEESPNADDSFSLAIWSDVEALVRGDVDIDDDSTGSDTRFGDPLRLHADSVGETMPYVNAVLGASRTLLRAPSYYGVSEAVTQSLECTKAKVSSESRLSSLMRSLLFDLSKRSSGFSFEDAQTVGLRLMRTAAADLNTALVLNTKGGIIPILCDMLANERTDNFLTSEVKEIGGQVPSEYSDGVQFVSTSASSKTRSDSDFKNHQNLPGTYMISDICVRTADLLNCLRGELVVEHGEASSFDSVSKKTNADHSSSSEGYIPSVRSLVALAGEYRQPPSFRAPSEGDSNKSNAEETNYSDVLEFLDNIKSRKHDHDSLARTRQLAEFIVTICNPFSENNVAANSTDAGSSGPLPSDESKSFLHAGAKFVVSFGWRHLNLSGDPADAASKLALCLSKTTPDNFRFNWYAATIFLSACLANPCKHSSDLAKSMLCLPYHKQFSLQFAQNVYEILAINSPTTLSTIRTGTGCGTVMTQSSGICGGGCAGISIAALVRRWTDQCFWNFLDFDYILMFVALDPLLSSPGFSRSLTGKETDLQARFVACSVDLAVSEYRGKNLSERRERSLGEVLMDGPLFLPSTTPDVTVWVRKIKSYRR